MATEPQRPIEKLLGDYARKRGAQAGAPRELHPADRRALQDEVRRQYGGGLRRGRSGWFSGLWAWPRFAWTATIGLLLLFSTAIWQMQLNKPRQERLAAMRPAEATKSMSWTRELAKEEKLSTSPASSTDRTKDKAPAKNAPSLAEVLSVASVPAPATLTNAADTYAAGGAMLAARSPGARPTVLNPASVPAPAAMPASPQSLVEDKKRAFADPAGQVAERPQSLPAAGLAGAGPATENEALAFSNAADFRALNDATLSETRLRNDTAPKPAAAAATLGSQVNVQSGPVLAAFRIEQAGSQIRVIDRDGSVYAGYLEAADNTLLRKAMRLQVPTLARAADSLAKPAPSAGSNPDAEAQSGAFWVAGTNRSLNQAVFFRGNFLPWTNVPPSPTASAFSPSAAQNNAQQQDALPLQNLRISGTAEIGDSGAVKIEANPATP